MHSEHLFEDLPDPSSLVSGVEPSLLRWLRHRIEKDVAAHKSRPADIGDWQLTQADKASPLEAELGYGRIQYALGNEPLIRSVQDNFSFLQELGHITRNSYARVGSEVLNTRLLPMIDVDAEVSPEIDRRKAGPKFTGTYCTKRQLIEACSFIAGGARRFFEVLGTETRHWTTRDRKAWNAAIHGQGMREQALLLESLSFDCIEAVSFLRAVPKDFAIGIYRTVRGYRLVFNKPMPLMGDQQDNIAAGVMKFLYADHAYTDIALRQGTYRARLTPKPWRGEHEYELFGNDRVMSLVGTVEDGDFTPDVEPRFTDPRLHALFCVLTEPYRATDPQSRKPLVAAAS